MSRLLRLQPRHTRLSRPSRAKRVLIGLVVVLIVIVVAPGPPSLDSISDSISESNSTSTSNSTTDTTPCRRILEEKRGVKGGRQPPLRRYVTGDFPGSLWGIGEATYLEWGSGESTSAVASLARRAYTIEHVAERCALASGLSETRCLAAEGRWTMYCHVLVSHENASSSLLEETRGYVQAPGRFGETTYDVVFVNGTRRGACARAITPYLRDGSVVAWNDLDDDGNDGNATTTTVGFERIERVGATVFFRFNETSFVREF